MPDDPRADLVRRVEDARARWGALAIDVGVDRMERPGAMGDWTFKDVASHITAWRRRTIAAGRGGWAGHDAAATALGRRPRAG